MEFNGKKILFLGDSITEGCGASSVENCFVSLLARKYNGAQIFNYGIGGTRIAAQRYFCPKDSWEHPFYTRVEAMEQGADLVCVFGGTNDYCHGDAPLGKLGDTTPDTFYGALYTVSKMLVNKYPNAKIAFFTPLHRSDERIFAKRDDGTWKLADYVNAVKRNAEYFAFPVLDLWNAEEFQPPIPQGNSRYFCDGLHPNDDGYRILAHLVEAFIKNLP